MGHGKKYGPFLRNPDFVGEQNSNFALMIRVFFEFYDEIYKPTYIWRAQR